MPSRTLDDERLDSMGMSERERNLEKRQSQTLRQTASPSKVGNWHLLSTADIEQFDGTIRRACCQLGSIVIQLGIVLLAR